MKIGMLVNNLDTTGGYQKLVLRLTSELTKLGNQVIIYTPSLNKETCYPEIINQLHIVALKNKSQSKSFLAKIEKYDKLITTYKQLMLLVDPDLDALIIHDEYSLLGAALAKMSKKNLAIIWMLNNQITSTINNYTASIIHHLKQAKGIKALIINILSLSGLIKYQKIQHLGLKKINSFAVYDSLNKKLVKKYLNREAIVVYAGADIESFQKIRPYRQYHYSNKELRLLSVGVIFPHRRYEDLIEATRLLSNEQSEIKTIIIGKPLAKKYYKELLKQANKDELGKNIQFIEYLNQKDLLRHYQEAGIFIFINDGFTWGISVFEAVAAGLPVIITNNIGAADIIKNNETGWIVQPKNPIEVAEAVKDIINNPGKTKKICERACQEINELLSWKSYTLRMLKLIKHES